MNSLLVKTPFDNISLLLKSSARGLSSVKFVPTDKTNKNKTTFQTSSGSDISEETTDPFLRQAALELEDYFSGSKKPFLTPLDIKGTTFQKNVWDVLRSIPHGGVLTYGDVALKIQNPKASRGVGGAVGKNPLPIFIPCHRILPSPAKDVFLKKTSQQISWSGVSVGGFSAGEDLDGPAIKKELLSLEDIVF